MTVVQKGDGVSDIGSVMRTIGGLGHSGIVDLKPGHHERWTSASSNFRDSFGSCHSIETTPVTLDSFDQPLRSLCTSPSRVQRRPSRCARAMTSTTSPFQVSDCKGIANEATYPPVIA